MNWIIGIYLTIGLLLSIGWMALPNVATGKFPFKFAFAMLLLVGWLPVGIATLIVNRNNNQENWDDF